ncbi:uncharacterized protein RSE6_12641 [Rhynchosporium secalis]|uniref:Monocarboxylate transporter 2 n=1 Tax=Rhynchosporium secalis TaxID=38038 RepID=A0A1E1MR20_RHYSE|nr:uncharacterized protein RSE6_12641 [Rhynchosporium secalis]
MATSTITTSEISVELNRWSQHLPIGGSINRQQMKVTPRRSGKILDPEENFMIQELLPVDGGAAAWKVLIAASVFEALLWGFPISFGVFQDFYSKQPEFEGNSQIAPIGTMAQGLCYLGAPLVAILTKRFSKYHSQQIWVAWPLCMGGLAAASFTSTVGGLIATQGIMYGLGFVTLIYPILLSFTDSLHGPLDPSELEWGKP